MSKTQIRPSRQSAARHVLSVFFVIIVMAAGCASRQRRLMSTPTLYTLEGQNDPFASVPLDLQGNVVDVLYVTDRMPVEEEGGAFGYSHLRSRSLAFGSCLVRIGKDISWEELVRESSVKKRRHTLGLEIAGITKIGSFPETPMPRDPRNPFTPSEEALERQREAVRLFQAEVERRLVLTPRKEAWVFVHGYSNSFEDAAFIMAELWHFFGREGVPVIYTWPAGRKGLLRGYTYDRESGEFTIHHLKQFMRALAGTPGLEAINIIAHSRGTDVAASGFRELVIEARPGGAQALAALKIRHVLLIASDMDMEVASQRFGAEGILAGAESATVYVSEDDKAIRLSSWLFDSIRRLGQLRPSDIPEERLEHLATIENLQVIDVRPSVRGAGHSYYRLDPAASSDLVLLLRYGRQPGAENGRPLEKYSGNYWILEEGYPAPQDD